MEVLRRLVARTHDDRAAQAVTGGPRRPTRRLTLAYICGLALIAMLAAGAYIVTDAVIEEQEHTATIVNLSGKQRALSQRVALFSKRYRELGRETDRRLLFESATEMALNHQILTQGDAALDIPDTPPEPVRRLYYDSPEEIDRRVVQFVEYAHRLAEESDHRSTAAAGLNEVIQVAAANELIESLNAIVEAYEDESLARIDRLQTIQMLVLIGLVVTLILEGLFLFRPLVRRVEEYSAQMFHLAMTDTMTGAANRRAFMDAATKEVARALRHETPLCVILMDIDRFKRINDTRGHAVGDEAIKHLVATAEKAMREEDTLGRLGGEEFAILMPYADDHQAAHMAERLRAKVEETVLTPSKGDPLPFTVSIGVARVALQDGGCDRALNHADMALYRSKTTGRNRVTIYAPGMGMEAHEGHPA